MASGRFTFAIPGPGMASGRAQTACEAPKSDSWRVIDFGGLVVHLMTAEAREFYALDKLYHSAPDTPWEEKKRAASGAR